MNLLVQLSLLIAALGVAFYKGGLWWILPAIGLVALLLVRRLSKKPKKPTPQIERETMPMLTPGNNTPAFHGIRVVELANTAAVPMLGRLMRELGAEVIKVEPLEGDYWRNWLVQFERPVLCFSRLSLRFMINRVILAQDGQQF